MGNELVKQTKLLGNYKTILGDGKTDIVLETLGKVYIKTGNNLKLINEVFKQLDRINKMDLDSIAGKIIITDSLEELEYPGDGQLIFDLKNKALYISYDDRYILLIDNIKIDESDFDPENNNNQSFKSDEYVKKTGDTMTGPLVIKTVGAPLIVASRKLVKNFNAQFLNGYSSDEVAIKALDEYINGHWTFTNVTDFNKDVFFKRDIGTEYFMDGYNGYGWKLDGSKNMLTVDYLVVRKAMMVYELIVNQISATNGAIWVTDACKLVKAEKVEVFNLNNPPKEIETDKWYLPYDLNRGINVLELIINKSNIANSYGEYDGIPASGSKTFYNFGYVFQLLEDVPNLLTLDFNNIEKWPKEIIGVKDPLTFKVTDFKVLYGKFFPSSIEKSYEESLTISEQIRRNKVYNTLKTPYMYSTQRYDRFSDLNIIQKLYIYYKYFGLDPRPGAAFETISRNIFVVTVDDENYPTIRENDLIRCLKFLDNNIKYYDALVAGRIDQWRFLIILAPSVFDNYSLDNTNDISEENNDHKTTGTEKVNADNYSKTILNPNEDAIDSLEAAKKYVENNPNCIIFPPEKGDGVVRIGNIIDKWRLNSLYLTSSDINSPYIQTVNNVRIPDYTVIYNSPEFRTVEYEGKTWYAQWVSKQTEGAIEIDKKYYLLYEEPNLNCIITRTDNKTGQKYYLGVFDSPVRARFGRLDGIKNPFFVKKLPHGYGLFSDNVYLTGEFYLNNGQSVVEFTKDQIKLEINSAGIDNNNLVLNSAEIPFEKFEDKGADSKYVDYIKLDLVEPLLADTDYMFQIGSSEIVSGTSISEYSVVIYNKSIGFEDKNAILTFNFKVGPERLYKQFIINKEVLSELDEVELRLYNKDYSNPTKASSSLVWRRIKLEKSVLLKDWQPAPEDSEEWQKRVFGDIEEIKKLADGAIDTWFEKDEEGFKMIEDASKPKDLLGIPQQTDWPITEWLTSKEPNSVPITDLKKIVEIYKNHIGDFYYSLGKRAFKFYYKKNNKSFSELIPSDFYWMEIRDTGILKALEVAKKALDTADGKRRIFVRMPDKPDDEYDIGDLWVNAVYPFDCGPDTEDTKCENLEQRRYCDLILRCISPKQKASLKPGDPDYKKDVDTEFSIKHWDLASRYNEALITLKNIADDYIITVLEQAQLKTLLIELTTDTNTLINEYLSTIASEGSKVINNKSLAEEVKEAVKNLLDALNAVETVINNITTTSKDYILRKSDLDEGSNYTRDLFLGVFNEYYEQKNILLAKINDPIRKWLEATGIYITEGKVKVAANLFEIRDIDTGTVTAKILKGGKFISRDAYLDNVTIRNGSLRIGDYTPPASSGNDLTIEGKFIPKVGMDINGAWFGGTVDRGVTENILNTQNTLANSFIRTDGSGYIACKNLWWDTEGILHTKNDTFFLDNGKTIITIIEEKLRNKIQVKNTLEECGNGDDGVLYVLLQDPSNKMENSYELIP